MPARVIVGIACAGASPLGCRQAVSLRPSAGGAMAYADARRMRTTALIGMDGDHFDAQPHVAWARPPGIANPRSLAHLANPPGAAWQSVRRTLPIHSPRRTIPPGAG